MSQEENAEENSSVNEESYGNETFSSSSSNGDKIHSGPPSEYDERNRIFHLNFIRRFVKEVAPIPKKFVFECLTDDGYINIRTTI